MKLGPKHVRLITPFWPTIFRRTLRFTGRRHMVQLQETALVAEGELLLFRCLGLERLFGRAMSSWTTVTVPYSRILSVPYRRKLVLRLAIVGLLLAFLALTLQLPQTDPAEWTTFALFGDAMLVVPVAVLGCIVWWRIPQSYALQFRSKDGKRTRFHFIIRTRAARKQFNEALAQYRQAARAHIPVGGDR